MLECALYHADRSVSRSQESRSGYQSIKKEGKRVGTLTQPYTNRTSSMQIFTCVIPKPQSQTIFQWDELTHFCRVDVSTRNKQHLDHLEVALLAGLKQGRFTALEDKQISRATVR